MSAIEEKTVAVLDKLDALATQYTPDVVNGAVTAVKVTAVSNLVWGAIGLACFFAIWWMARRTLAYYRCKENFNDGDVVLSTCAGIGLIICGIFALTTAFSLFETWNWVAIFNPKLALAHQILGL